MSGSILDSGTKANPSVAYYSGGGGGGGGGSVINTSSITASTITAQGTVETFLAGAATPAIYWAAELDGTGNSVDILSADVTQSAYRDVRLSDSTGAPLQLLREQIIDGGASLGYATNPAAPPNTGLRFVSSLNGGADATALLTASDYFPMGQSLIPFATLNPIAPAGFGAVLTAGFNVVPQHLYGVSFQVSEAVTGTPAPQDRVSYQIGGQVLDTIAHTEISTLQGVNPLGRTVNGVFRAPGNSVQVAVGNNAGSLQSTLIACQNTFINGVVLRDLGPQIVLP